MYRKHPCKQPLLVLEKVLWYVVPVTTDTCTLQILPHKINIQNSDGTVASFARLFVQLLVSGFTVFNQSSILLIRSMPALQSEVY